MKSIDNTKLQKVFWMKIYNGELLDLSNKCISKIYE